MMIPIGIHIGDNMQQAFQNSLNWTVGIVTGGVKTSVYPTFQGVFGDTIVTALAKVLSLWCLVPLRLRRTSCSAQIRHPVG